MKTQRSKQSTAPANVQWQNQRRECWKGKGWTFSLLWEPQFVFHWPGGSQNPAHLWPAQVGSPSAAGALLLPGGDRSSEDHSTQEIDKCSSALIINVNCALQSLCFILHDLRKSITTFSYSRSQSSRISFITTQGRGVGATPTPPLSADPIFINLSLWNWVSSTGKHNVHCGNRGAGEHLFTLSIPRLRCNNLLITPRKNIRSSSNNSRFYSCLTSPQNSKNLLPSHDLIDVFTRKN